MNTETKTQLQEIVDTNTKMLAILNQMSDKDFKKNYKDGVGLVRTDGEIRWSVLSPNAHRYQSKSEYLQLNFSNFNAIVGDCLKERNN